MSRTLLSTNATGARAKTSLLVSLLAILGAINFADRAVIGLAAPAIIAEIHLSTAQWGIVGSSFFLLFPLSSLAVTAWSDWVGTRKILALLAVVWSLVQFASLVIASFLPLVISRVLLGAGEGPYYGTSTHAASRQIGPAQRGVVWAACWLLLTRERQQERSAHSPIPWKTLFSLLWTPAVSLIILASFASYWYVALLISWVPAYFVEVWHLPQRSVLYVLGISLPWLMAGLLQVGIGVLSDRGFKRGGSRLRVQVLSITLLALLCLSLTPLGATFPLVAALLADLIPSSSHGTFLGLAVALSSLAGLIAPAVTGLLIQHATSLSVGFQLAYLAAAGFIACCSSLCWLFVRPPLAMVQ